MAVWYKRKAKYYLVVVGAVHIGYAFSDAPSTTGHWELYGAVYAGLIGGPTDNAAG